MRSKLTCLFILLVSVVSLAQDKPIAEITGAYQFTRLYGVNVPLGWDASVNVVANDWFGFAGDFGGATKSQSGVTGTLLTYGGGPQFTLRTASVEPYFRLTFGAAHVSASGYGFSGGTTAFLLSPGGGADFRISNHIWLRLGANYPFARKNSVTVDGIQALVGVTYHFGGRRHTTATGGDTTPRTAPVQGMKIAALDAMVVMGRSSGAEITDEAPNVVAALAGIHTGDVINAVDGNAVKTPTELAAELSNRHTGDKVRLGYLIHGTWQAETVVSLGH